MQLKNYFLFDKRTKKYKNLLKDYFFVISFKFNERKLEIVYICSLQEKISSNLNKNLIALLFDIN